VLSGDDTPALANLTLAANAVHVDSKNGNLYYVDPTTNTIFQADADDTNPTTYEWKSKRFVLPQATSFSAIRVDGDYGQASLASAYNAKVAAIQAANATIFATGKLNSTLNAVPVDGLRVNGSALTDIPPLAANRSVQVNIYVDGALATTLSFLAFDIQRIPPIKGRTIELDVRGNLSVRSIALATTVQELLTQ